MGTAVPTWVRFAVGLAILGVGVSLAFAFMPDSTTNVRVVAGIACVACLVFVALVWRRIRMKQEFLLKEGTTTEYLLERLEFVLKDVTAGKDAKRIRDAALKLRDKIELDTPSVNRKKITMYRNAVDAFENKIQTAARDADLKKLTDEYKTWAKEFDPKERERREALRQLGRDMNVLGESGFYKR